MAVAQQRHRRDHVGVALARGEMTDGHERQTIRWRRALRRNVGAQVHDAGVTRPERGAAPCGPGAVGEHEPGVPERGRDGRPAGARALYVVAVDRHHQRRGTRGAADRVAGGHGVVRVDQVERELPAQPAQRPAQHGRGPGSPARVAPRPRRRQVAHVVQRQPVELGPRRLADHRQRAPDVGRADRRQRRHRPVQHEHPHVGPGVARGERLAVRPDATDGVAGAGVVLGDDQRLHVQDRCMTIVRCASSAAVYGRSVEKLRGLGHRLVVGVGRGDPPQAVSDRGGVDDADAPSVLERQRRPVLVQSPAESQRRERQQRVERRAVKRRRPARSRRTASRGRRPAAGGG